MSLPKHINYSSIKPQGIPSEIIHAKFYPQTTFQTINSNDIVRFQINAPNVFWDPYSAYIQLDVDVTDMPEGVTYQLDSSAQSFINELILTGYGKEIERIQEFDTLMCCINDMSLTPLKRQVRAIEGMGYNMHNYGPNFQTNNQTSTGTLGSHLYTGGTEMQTIYKSNYGSVGFDPFKNQDQITKSVDTVQKSAYPLIIGPGGCKTGEQHVLPVANNFLNSDNSIIDYDTLAAGTAHNIQVVNPYIVAQLSSLEISKQLNDVNGYNGTYYLSSALGGMGIFDYNLAATSETSQPRIVAYTPADRTILNNSTFSAYDPDMIKNMEDGLGLCSAYCPALTNTNWEHTFSKSWKQKIMYAGVPIERTITKYSFSIPLMSSILGFLLPREDYKYIPMFLLPDLMLEIRLNPYAFFTSGYSYTNSTTTSQWTNVMKGVGPSLANRIYKISNIVLNAEVLKFTDAIRDQVMSVATQGIALHTSQWKLGPQYLLNDSSQATGTWHINMPFESMKNLITIFLSTDYLNYPFCRKQFRLSSNLTWYQVKIGTTFFPSLAIQGNAGDTHMARNTGANNEFIIGLLKAFGKYQDVLGDCSINNVNFAVNQRPYDVTKTGALYWPYNYKQKFNNVHTAAGMPLLWENLVRGQAIYGINFETLNQDVSVMTGINTQKGPFEISLKSDNTRDPSQPNYDRPRTMINFIQHDAIIILKPGSVEVLGYG